jgi:hypothetical protein
MCCIDCFSTLPQPIAPLAPVFSQEPVIPTDEICQSLEESSEKKKILLIWVWSSFSGATGAGVWMQALLKLIAVPVRGCGGGASAGQGGR